MEKITYYNYSFTTTAISKASYSVLSFCLLMALLTSINDWISRIDGKTAHGALQPTAISQNSTFMYQITR